MDLTSLFGPTADPLSTVGVGPQTNGTYGVPDTAVQVNDPSNTAGYPAVTSAADTSILTKGMQFAQQLMSWDIAKTQIDRQYQATNGGLYQAGQPAVLARTSVGGSNLTLLALLVVGVVLLAHHG